MLVIVKDRDVKLCFQFFLNLETGRGRYVLELNGAKAGCYPDNSLNKSIDMGGIYKDGKSADANEFCQESGFSFHNG